MLSLPVHPVFFRAGNPSPKHRIGILEDRMHLASRFISSTSGRWIITLLWMVILTILLLQPLTDPIIPTGVKPAPPSFQRELFFSTAHGIIFALSSLLWSWTLHKHIKIESAVRIAALGLFVYGIGTELGQSYTPGRAPQGIDLLANGIGVVAGAWLYYQWISSILERVAIRFALR